MFSAARPPASGSGKETALDYLSDCAMALGFILWVEDTLVVLQRPPQGQQPPGPVAAHAGEQHPDRLAAPVPRHAVEKHIDRGAVGVVPWSCIVPQAQVLI